MQYVDVMSFYHSIRKYFMFPVGSPVIHFGDAFKGKEAYIRMDNLIKCSIFTKERFYHPVLPFTCSNKLMFRLFRTCVLTSFSCKECGLTENEDRDLTDTWVMDEVRLAVEIGYRVLEVYEVYECQVTQCNPETGEGGHFVDYINTFVKLNLERAAIPTGSIVPNTRNGMWNRFGRVKGYG